MKTLFSLALIVPASMVAYFLYTVAMAVINNLVMF